MENQALNSDKVTDGNTNCWINWKLIQINVTNIQIYSALFKVLFSPPISFHKLLKLGKAVIVIVEAVKLLLGVLILLFNENNYFKKIKYACCR